MAYIDPRSLSSGVDLSAISGGITERLIALLGLANQGSGQKGVGTSTINLEGFDAEQILNSYQIGADPDTNSPWYDDQQYYYQSSSQRLSQVQQIINKNITKLESDLNSNISGLFSLLNSKSQDLNQISNHLRSSADSVTVESLGTQLDEQIRTHLTSDQALNEIMNSFFSQISLTAEKINQEIFDLLNDYDDDYANGASDHKKYLLQTPGQPTRIIDTLDELFTETVNQGQATFASVNPTATFSQDVFIDNSVGLFYTMKNLKLNPEFMKYIVLHKGYGPRVRADLHNSADFIKKLSFNEFKSLADGFYGTSGSATNSQLFKDHLDIGTPKYIEDQRTLYDLLLGQSDDTSNLASTLFKSFDETVEDFDSSAVEMMHLGYSHAAKNKLQQTIRKNPEAAIRYLQEARANANDDEQKKIDENIIMLHGRKTALEQYESESGDQYSSSENIDSTFDLDTVLNAIDSNGSMAKSHKLLYGGELIQASQKNAEYYGQKLATPAEDGSMPEDTRPIPPWVSPTIYSAIIAKIGNTLLDKVKRQEENTNISGQDWINQFGGTLATIGSKISSGEISSAGEGFLNNLKDNFKGVINGFYKQFTPLKAEADAAKTLLDQVIANPETAANILSDNGYTLPEGVRADVFAAENYKNKLLSYSDSVSNFSLDANGNGIADLEEKLKKSITDSGLDIDGNGQNDFIDIQGICGNMGIIGDQLSLALGTQDAVSGGIENQSIRRLIMLMFVINMMEPSDWNYAMDEADTSKYQTS